jgi:hypothetical protein
LSVGASSFLGGAKSRLLPASIPFRFFAAAVVAHALLWGAVALGAAEVPSFTGGLGVPLAAVHFLTLGMLAMTAIGAAFQLLPVATKQPMGSQRAMRITSWIFIPGALVLAAAMALRDVVGLAVGGILTAAGLLLFAALVAQNLWRVRGLAIVVANGRAALLAVVLVAVLGFVLAADYHHGWGIDHARLALAHFLLGAFGFMGFLAMGFSYVLVPMFAVSPAPQTRLGYAVLGTGLAGLAAGVAGALLGHEPVLAAGAALGLVAVGIHLEALRSSLKARMKKRLGLAFVLVRGAWAALAASLALGLALARGAREANGAALGGGRGGDGWLGA